MSSRTQSTRQPRGSSRSTPQPPLTVFRDSDGLLDPGPDPPANVVREVGLRTEAIRRIKEQKAKENLTEQELDEAIGDNLGSRSARAYNCKTPESLANAARKIASGKKQKNGGIVGVRPLYGRNGNITSFRSEIGDPETGQRVAPAQKCVGDAVESRNRMADERYPGQDEYQCCMQAAIAKWGCTCGKHLEL